MYKNKKEIKEAAEHLREEMLWHQYLKEWEKDNLINFNDYFTYSGETEEYKELVAKWRYDENGCVYVGTIFYWNSFNSNL